jgi:hypothetical protein
VRGNRLREAQWQVRGPSASRSGTHIRSHGPRTPADAPLTDESAFRSNGAASVSHAPSARPVSRHSPQR